MRPRAGSIFGKKPEQPDEMETFIAQAKHLASTVDEAGRKKLSDTLRELSVAIESPSDTMQRLRFAVRQSKNQYTRQSLIIWS